MDLLFVPNLGRKRKNVEPAWGAEFFADAFKQHSQHKVTVEHSLDNMNNYDVVWVHNIANLLKGFTGRVETGLKLAKRHPPIIGGVRGTIGFEAAKHFLRAFDAVHTSNEALTSKCTRINRQSHTLSSGVKPEWYKTYNSPPDFTVGWAGDPTKNMKNTDLLDQLDAPVFLATKQSYIPHDDMPEKFYQKISVLVHPSRHEGSNRVITEAAACALPIICTDVGHNSKIVHSDWMVRLNGTTVDNIKRKLGRLRDPFVAKVVGEYNQVKAKVFTWPMVIERADNIITQTLK